MRWRERLEWSMAALFILKWYTEWAEHQPCLRSWDASPFVLLHGEKSPSKRGHQHRRPFSSFISFIVSQTNQMQVSAVALHHFGLIATVSGDSNAGKDKPVVSSKWKLHFSATFDGSTVSKRASNASHEMRHRFNRCHSCPFLIFRFTSSPSFLSFHLFFGLYLSYRHGTDDWFDGDALL